MRKAKRSAMHGESGYERIKNDAYWTPDWVTRALSVHELAALASVTRNATLPVWEPAAGSGAISRELVRAGYSVISTDIEDYGFPLDRKLDFLSDECLDFVAGEEPRAIITNPPYEVAAPFVERAIDVMKPYRGYVAMLLRNEWDCARTRRHLFNPPFARKIVLQRRPKWSAEEKASPRHNFAWFIWDHHHAGAPRLEYAS